MRLIDADEYIKKLRERIGIEPTWSHSGLRIAIFELHNMPTIDAVEVVRCKDCKHFPIGRDRDGWVRWPVDDEGYEDGTCVYFCEDGYYSMAPPIEGFCHKGERREE